MPSVNGTSVLDKPGKTNFFRVANPKDLLPILEERHPVSCNIYNQVIIGDKFGKDMKFYTLSPDINSDTWIVCEYTRMDYGQNISISAPNAIIEGTQPIPDSIREAFASDELIQWNEEIGFIPVPRPVSLMIADISTRIKGNVTELHPCFLYYMEKEDALNLPISPKSGVELRRLDPGTDSEFIFATCRYKKESTREVIPTWIKNNPSSGVYVDGSCVSGVVTSGYGLISALFTLEEHRKKGYAKLAMSNILRESAIDGCIPCSAVEVKDDQSNAFHLAVGVKVVCMSDLIYFKHIVH